MAANTTKRKKQKKTFPYSRTASGIEVTAEQHGDAYAVSMRRGSETVATVALDAATLPALASGRFVVSIGSVRSGEDVTAIQIDIRNASALTGADVLTAVTKVVGRVVRSAMRRVTGDVTRALTAQKDDVAKLMSTVSPTRS